jgi:hypothetical protein
MPKEVGRRNPRCYRGHGGSIRRGLSTSEWDSTLMIMIMITDGMGGITHCKSMKPKIFA